MSVHLAAATVTAALRKTLQDALDAADPQVPGARVTTTRPNAPAADLPKPGAHIFLYQTTPSAARGDGLLRFWDTANGRPLWKLQAHSSGMTGLRVDGDNIVTRGETRPGLVFRAPPRSMWRDLARPDRG